MNYNHVFNKYTFYPEIAVNYGFAKDDILHYLLTTNRNQQVIILCFID